MKHNYPIMYSKEKLIAKIQSMTADVASNEGLFVQNPKDNGTYRQIPWNDFDRESLVKLYREIANGDAITIGYRTIGQKRVVGAGIRNPDIYPRFNINPETGELYRKEYTYVTLGRRKKNP